MSQQIALKSQQYKDREHKDHEGKNLFAAWPGRVLGIERGIRNPQFPTIQHLNHAFPFSSFHRYS